MAKFTLNELLDLTLPDGGQFSTDSLADALAFCRRLARSHYENFPVGSLLIDKSRREHFYSVYAFARIADDITDEFSDKSETRIGALGKMASLLDVIDACGNDYSHPSEGLPLSNPVFMALMKTVKENNIPVRSLKKLLDAFRQDIDFKQPRDFADLESYCHNSANPVGELILRIYSLYDETTAPLSDCVCTGLQLVNFWQDFSRDIPDKRLYIPVCLTEKYGVESESLLKQDAGTGKLQDLLNELYDSTEKYFQIGAELLKYLKPLRLRVEIALTIRGGLLVMKRIRRSGTGILIKRPKLLKWDYLKLIILVLLDGINIKNRAGKLRKG